VTARFSVNRRKTRGHRPRLQLRPPSSRGHDRRSGYHACGV